MQREKGYRFDSEQPSIPEISDRGAFLCKFFQDFLEGFPQLSEKSFHFMRWFILKVVQVSRRPLYINNNITHTSLKKPSKIMLRKLHLAYTKNTFGKVCGCVAVLTWLCLTAGSLLRTCVLVISCWESKLLTNVVHL